MSHQAYFHESCEVLLSSKAATIAYMAQYFSGKDVQIRRYKGEGIVIGLWNESKKTHELRTQAELLDWYQGNDDKVKDALDGVPLAKNVVVYYED